MAKYNKARQNLIDMYIKSLEEDEIPFEKMWMTKQPINAISNKKYRGVNNLILSFVSSERNYKDNRWCTYNQIKSHNWKFKGDVKGQGVCIEYWTKYNIKDKKIYSLSEYEKVIKNNPEAEKDFRIIIKNAVVFNADLIDGISKQVENDDEEKIKTSDFIDNIINNLGVIYIEKGDMAYYVPATDEVVIPPSYTFKNEYAYYATQLHELAHSTGNKNRLNRQIENSFGSLEYAKEELRAEISSSFLMQKLGLEYDERHLKNHKAYIQNWIKIIKDKPSELFKAISDADKIVDYLEEHSVKKEYQIEQNNDNGMEL